MNLKNCHNFNDFRKLAKKRLPSPIFHYIDGGADDEKTLKRNTDSFDDCDLIPNILASVGKPDLSTTVFGKKLICQSFFHQLQCKDSTIMKVTKPQQELLKNLGPFIVCLQWPIILLKKLLIFQMDQSYFNYMFTKINQLLTI